MKNYIFTLCCLLALTAQAQTQTAVSYLERSWDAEKKQVVTTTKTCTDYKEIASKEEGRESFAPGWYVIKGNVHHRQFIFTGETHLILTDGCKMTAQLVTVNAGNKLHIHSQSDGDQQGQLEAYNDYFDVHAPIGGMEKTAMGSLYIHGGKINAHQHKGSGAAIGGGGQESPNDKSELIVYGGQVTATNDYEAAIGGGYMGGQGFTLTVYGGTVEAESSLDGAAIGGGHGGKGGTVNVYGGKVTARCVKGGSGAGIGGGWHSDGGDVHVHGGEVYAYGGLGASGIGGSYASHGGTLEVTGGMVFASGNENDKELSPAIGGGTYSDGVKVTVTGGVLMAVTKQSSELHPAPIGAGSYSGGHLYYSNVEIRLGDAMKVSYCDHQDAIKDAKYREGQYLHEVATALREETCQNRSYSFVRIDGCSHGQYTYVSKDSKKHVRQCTTCNVKTEEEHNFKGGKCICGKAEEESDYWNVTYYHTTDGKTYAKGDEYQVIKGMQTTPPIAPKVDGLTLVGYLPVTGAAPAGIEMADSEKTGGQLTAVGAVLEPSANTVYYARYRYNYTESWQWNDDCTTAVVTLTNPLAGEPVKVTATIVEDQQKRVEPTEEKLGEAHYTATATYKKSDGVTYQFEDRQKVILYQPRIIILDALDTEGKNTRTLEQYEGFEAEVTINNLTLKKDGKLHSLCLPFSLKSLAGTPLEGATLYQYNSWSIANDLRISFLPCSDMEAGIPYFYRFSDKGTDVSHPTFSPVIIDDIDGSGKYETNFDLLGVYETVAFADDIHEQTVVLDGNELIHSPETVDAFSCYFYIVPNLNSDGSRKVSVLTLDFGNGDMVFTKKLFDSWVGHGTEASPYIISSTPQLKELQEAFSGDDAARLKGKYFRQGAHITFDKTSVNSIAPIPQFTAHYDGAGYVIGGLNISLTGSNAAALFASLEEGASVRNVILQNSTISGPSAAAIAYYIRKGATVSNCHVLRDVTIEGTFFSAGGVVGNVDGEGAGVSNCSSHAAVTGCSGAGGVVGNAFTGSVTDCLYLGNSVNVSDATKVNYCQAIAGQKNSSVTMTGCYFTSPTLTDANAKLMPMDNVDNSDFLNQLHARDEFLLKAGLTEDQIAYDLTLNGRTLNAKQQADGSWKSVAFTACLPFDMDLAKLKNADDIKVYKLHEVDVDNKVLQFTNDFPILKAGEPYVLVLEKGSVTFTGKDVLVAAYPLEPQIVKNADASKDMGWWCGTLKRIDNDGLIAQHSYIIQSDGKFRRVSKKYPNVYLYPFRAYYSAPEPLDFSAFEVKFIPTNNGEETGDVTDFPADEFDSDGEMDDETGINTIESSMFNVRSKIYDLQGRKLTGKPTKGLYIVNGKKVVVK